jgi:hypothetical protein
MVFVYHDELIGIKIIDSAGCVKNAEYLDDIISDSVRHYEWPVGQHKLTCAGNPTGPAACWVVFKELNCINLIRDKNNS